MSRPDKIGRMAENFEEMQKRARRRDTLAQLLVIFLFGFGALCTVFIIALILHVLGGL